MMNGSMKEAFLNEYKKILLNDIEARNFPERLLEKYEFLECLKETKSTGVYIARHKVLNHKVIIKYCDKQEYTNEHQIISKLNHKDIPRIYDVYLEKNMIIIIEEFFDGKSLGKLLEEEETFSIKEIIGIFLGLCEIFCYLHSFEAPIIYRDIKPENIIYTKTKEIKLIDFGTARNYSRDIKKDTTYLGTEGYAAPEQYGFSQTDKRTDIYGMGILISKLLENTDGKVPLKLVKIVKKCTYLDPEQRYASMKEIYKELADLGKPIKKVYAAAVPVIFAVLAFIIVYLSFFYNKVQHEIVKFSSEDFAEVISEKLDKPIEKITYEDLAEIRELRVWGDTLLENEQPEIIQSAQGAFVGKFEVNGKIHSSRGVISSLDDIKYLKSLETLELVKQNISDITPLRDINLNILNLNDNYIKDADPIYNMTMLTQLYIGGNPIENMDGLMNVSTITKLEIADTEIHDLNWLAEMKYLNYLNASMLDIEDFSPISNCRNLKVLDLSNNGIKDFSWAGGLESLEALNIYYNEIYTIEGIELLKNLKHLHVDNNFIGDFSPLTELKYLNDLNISNNPVEDISFIYRLKGLERLELSGINVEIDYNQINDNILIRQ